MTNKNIESGNLEERILKIENKVKDYDFNNLIKWAHQIEDRVKRLKMFPIRFYTILGFLTCLGIIGSPGVYLLYKSYTKTNEAKNKAIAIADSCEIIYKNIKKLDIVNSIDQYKEAENKFNELKSNADVLVKRLEKKYDSLKIAHDKYEKIVQRFEQGVTLKFPMNTQAEKRRYLSGTIVINLEGEAARLLNGKSAKRCEFDILFDESTKSIAPILSPNDSFKLKLIEY